MHLSNRIHSIEPAATPIQLPPPVQINTDVGISGRYHIELLDSDRTVINEWKFSNIITDGGMNAIGDLVGGETMVFDYFQMGEGSTPVSSSDVGLQSPIAIRVNTEDTAPVAVTGSDSTGSYWDVTFSKFFGSAEGNGNITEFGAFTLSTGGRLTSRALVRDGSGIPTTITKTSANQLRLRYTIRMYLPTTDVTGSLYMAGSTYDYIIRPNDIFNQYTWGYGREADATYNINGGHLNALLHSEWTSTSQSLQLSPSGTLVDPTGSIVSDIGSSRTSCTSANLYAYTTDTFYRDIEYVADASVYSILGTTGIRTAMLQPNQINDYSFINSRKPQYQISFTPPIPKTNLNQLTMRFRFGWYRAKIYE